VRKKEETGRGVGEQGEGGRKERYERNGERRGKLEGRKKGRKGGREDGMNEGRKVYKSIL